MQATRHFPSLPLAPKGRQRESRAIAAPGAIRKPIGSALQRGIDRFLERLATWGDGATHRRLGSWTRL